MLYFAVLNLNEMLRIMNARVFYGTIGFLVLLFIPYGRLNAQSDFEKKRWRDVANSMPAAWYGGEQSRKVANQLIVRQMDCGGWQKNINYHRLLTKKELAGVRRVGPGATIDNSSTTTEMIFLAKMYGGCKDERYKESFVKALRYLFESQYENGGWPQFYPPRAQGHYSSHITYNDDAMVNVLKLLCAVAENRSPFAQLHLSDSLRKQAGDAFDRGIDCILKTQIKVNGEPTVWCAQHDEHTLAPAAARAYELVSFSGSESADLVLLLMSLPNPSAQVKAAVKGAVKWFENHKVENLGIKRIKAGTPQRDVQVVTQEGAVLWARFYDLNTGKPFFCDRDGVKRTSLAEVGQERRGGYSWYTDRAQKVLDAYPQWAKINGL